MTTWTPETVKGWRIWTAPSMDPHGRVGSISMPSNYWDKEVPPATCWKSWALIEEDHPAPHRDCACGYWSLKPGIINHPLLWHKPIWPFIHVVMQGVIGWVESWGTIWEYEYGYRAERIKINSFVKLNQEWADRWARWYVPSDDRIHERWRTLDLKRYQYRVERVAHVYNVPIVDIDESADEVLTV